jgi:hypothetical protein
MDVDPCTGCSATLGMLAKPQFNRCELYDVMGLECPPETCSFPTQPTCRQPNPSNSYQRKEKEHMLNENARNIRILTVPARDNPFDKNVFAYQVIFRQVGPSSNSMSTSAVVELFRAAAASGRLDNVTVAVKIGGDIIFTGSRAAKVSVATETQLPSPYLPAWAIALIAVVAALAVSTGAYVLHSRWRKVPTAPSSSEPIQPIQPLNTITAPPRLHLYSVSATLPFAPVPAAAQEETNADCQVEIFDIIVSANAPEPEHPHVEPPHLGAYPVVTPE